MNDGRKELEAVLWAGADVLRSKMDANEYKDYLLSFVFYKYLSDTFLVKVYDLLNDCEPETMEQTVNRTAVSQRWNFVLMMRMVSS